MNTRIAYLFIAICVLVGLNTFSQSPPPDSTIYQEPTYIDESSDLVTETFLSTRIVNGHSVETLKKGTLEFRIEHKFGDIAGTSGGPNTLYGLDNVSDIRIAFEYGITNKLMAGFGRSRGTSLPYHSLLDGFLKYRLTQQEKHKMPVSISLTGMGFFSYMPASSVLTDVSSFPKAVHRFSYSTQLNIARKFGKHLSIALMPTLVYRNYVASNDQNALFSLGGVASYFINSKTSLSVEYYANFQKEGTRTAYHNSLSVAVDWVTFGHTFKVFLTNSGGFGDVQFIPYTNSDWAKGAFRLGFCLGRKYVKE
jgi:hypothetical protein